MPEPDRTALVYIKEAYKQDFNLDLSFLGVPDSLIDNDGFLGRCYEIPLLLPPTIFTSII